MELDKNDGTESIDLYRYSELYYIRAYLDVTHREVQKPTKGKKKVVKKSSAPSKGVTK